MLNKGWYEKDIKINLHIRLFFLWKPWCFSSRLV